MGQADVDRRLLRTLWPRVYLPNLLFAMGQGAIIPVLAITAKHLGASASLAAFIVALNGLGIMLMDLPAGWITARLGEVRSSTLATGLLLVGLVGCYLARTPWEFGLGVFIQASGWAIWSLVRLINVSRLANVTVRGRALSIIGGVMRGGQGLGPLLVAAFALHGSTKVSFAIYIICALCGWGLLEAARDRTDHAARAVASKHSGLMRTLRHHRRDFATAGVSSYMLGVLRASRQVVVPLWGAYLGFSVTKISLVYGISSLLDLSLFYWSGLLSDRYGRRSVAIPCIGIMALGHVLLPLTHSFVPYVAVAMVLGFGNGLGSGIVMTLAADRAPSDNRAVFLSLWRFVADSGNACGPLFDGLLIGALTLAAAAPVVGLIGLGATAYTWRTLRETAVLPGREPVVEVPPGAIGEPGAPPH